LGHPLTRVFHIRAEQNGQPVPDLVELVLGKRRLVTLNDQTVLVSRNGREIPITARIHPIVDEANKVSGIVAVFSDASEKRQSQEGVRRLATIVECSEDAIISKSLDGVILSWNRGAERLYGYSAAEAIGQNIALVVPPDSRDELREMLQRIRRGERVEHCEVVLLRKDGVRFHALASISPLKNERGEVIGASSIIRDITERKRAEEAVWSLNRELQRRVTERTSELLASNRELEALAYSVSHDLRAPLRRISSFLTLLRKKTQSQLDALSQRYLNQALEASERTGVLLDELLQFSRLGRATFFGISAPSPR